MAEKDQVKSTISEELLEELFEMFFYSIFGGNKSDKEYFDTRIEEKFKKNFKTNFPDFIEKNTEKAAEKEKPEKEQNRERNQTNIGKAMLAFSAMFDEGEIEGYKNELAKKEQSKRLEKVFFSEKGALKYYNENKDKNDEIIQEINKKINQKKQSVNNLLGEFKDPTKIGSLDSILKEDEYFKGVINYLNQRIDNDNNGEKAKSLKEELTKYKGKDPDSLFLKDAVKDFVKYNKENCEIKDGNIVAKKDKKEVEIPSLENNKYFKIDEIKKYLEEKDLKLKKFIETRNLISSGNNEIINKFLKEYDKIQNSKYAKKIKEYQKNYSEKKKRAKEIDKLDKENDIRIKTIEENEEKINTAEKDEETINTLIKKKKEEINEKKDDLKKIGLLNRILNKKAAKEAKIIKESIKTEELFIKKTQNDLKELKKTIKEKKKINEDYKKDICKSVKEINKNYHTGKVELKYKDLKDKKGSKINGIYGKEVKGKVSEDTKSVLNDSYEGKHFKKLQEAEKKLQKEHRKNIFSSKKIEEIIRQYNVDTEMNENKDIINLKKSLKTLKGITKESAIKNISIVTSIKKEQKNTLNQ